MNKLAAFNFNVWLREHADKLKPPVNNQLIWEDADLMVTVVGGPNSRVDYHVDPVEEFFYQFKGNSFVKIMAEDGPYDVHLREGDIFLMPPRVPHSPQRPEAGSLCLVVEPKRPDGEMDAFEWYCENCHHRVHRVDLILKSLVTDLPPLFKDFAENMDARLCKSCGELHPGK